MREKEGEEVGSVRSGVRVFISAVALRSRLGKDVVPLGL